MNEVTKWLLLQLAVIKKISKTEDYFQGYEDGLKSGVVKGLEMAREGVDYTIKLSKKGLRSFSTKDLVLTIKVKKIKGGGV